MNDRYCDGAFAVIAGNAPREAAEALRGHFSHVILLPADQSVGEPVAHHPDMIFAVVGDVLVTSERYYSHCGRSAIDEICALGGFRLILDGGKRGAEYPLDVGFNVLVCGSTLIGRLDALSAEIASLGERLSLNMVNVRQGYAACSTLYIPSQNLICTADRGIGAVCQRFSADVVMIFPDSGIMLPGYDRGFIGGCAGVWEDVVFFYGDPRCHPALDPLCRILDEKGITMVPLLNGTLSDYGGIRIFPVRKD